MNDREKLHEIIDSLPPPQIQALLTLLDSVPALGDDDFALALAQAPEEDADEDTVARILAAEDEPGDVVSHGELKRRLHL